MQTENIFPVVCGALLLGVAVPAVLFGMNRRGIIGQINLLRRSVQTARDPWKSEDDSLDELAERVRKLNDTQEE